MFSQSSLSALPDTRAKPWAAAAVGAVVGAVLGAVLFTLAPAHSEGTALYTAPLPRPATASVAPSTPLAAPRPRLVSPGAAPAPASPASPASLTDSAADREFAPLSPAPAPGASVLHGLGVLSLMAASFLVGTLYNGRKATPPMAMASVEAEEAAEWRGGKAISGLTSDVKTISTIEDVAKVLPHRYPFLLVDKVVEFEAGKRAVGIKNITMNEPQFTGHFPDRPIMPGVLMIEAMAQLGGIIALQQPVSDGEGVFFFAGINGVRWRRPVVPGDTLVMEMELVSFKERFGIAKMKGKAYVDGQVAVQVEEFTFALAK